MAAEGEGRGREAGGVPLLALLSLFSVFCSKTGFNHDDYNIVMDLSVF